MTSIPRDDNHVPVIAGVSSVDGTTITLIYVDPTTHRVLTQNAIGTGALAPATTPTYVGQMFVDTTAKKVYIATGTSSSADWTVVN